jgi:hypothetical protein
MGKITLEFDDVEEREDALNAINGFKWKMVVYELDQYYRGIYKYSEVDSEIEMAEKVREEIMEVLRNNELFL